jgi:hypothetical protein
VIGKDFKAAGNRVPPMRSHVAAVPIPRRSYSRYSAQIAPYGDTHSLLYVYNCHGLSVCITCQMITAAADSDAATKDFRRHTNTRLKKQLDCRALVRAINEFRSSNELIADPTIYIITA